MSKSPYLIPDLLLAAAERAPDSVALHARKVQIDYATLAALVDRFAEGLCQLGLQKQDRVAIYLNKCPETVGACFGTSQPGGVFVPVNPLLKAPQVGLILRDSGATVMVTTADRLADLESELAINPTLRYLVIVGDESVPDGARRGVEYLSWQQLLDQGPATRRNRVIDLDIASILYTSGSTGRPKGVVLSHRNMPAGAHSVSTYLENHAAPPVANCAAPRPSTK